MLDFAANGELLSLIKRLGSLSEECVRYYGAQLLDAVDFMHSRGVLHRDLKPENILLDKYMRIKVTDFGTAYLVNHERDADGNELESYPQNTAAKSFVGTAEYVSPELLNQRQSQRLATFGRTAASSTRCSLDTLPLRATMNTKRFKRLSSFSTLTPTLSYRSPRPYQAHFGHRPSSPLFK